MPWSSQLLNMGSTKENRGILDKTCYLHFFICIRISIKGIFPVWGKKDTKHEQTSSTTFSKRKPETKSWRKNYCRGREEKDVHRTSEGQEEECRVPQTAWGTPESTEASQAGKRYALTSVLHLFFCFRWSNDTRNFRQSLGWFAWAVIYNVPQEGCLKTERPKSWPWYAGSTAASSQRSEPQVSRGQRWKYDLHLVRISDWLQKNRARSRALNFATSRSARGNTGPAVRAQRQQAEELPHSQPQPGWDKYSYIYIYTPWLLSVCSQTFFAFYPSFTLNIPGEGGNDTCIRWHGYFHKLTQNLRDPLHGSNIMWKINFQLLQI